jgi:hypothetical protein
MITLDLFYLIILVLVILSVIRDTRYVVVCSSTVEYRYRKNRRSDVNHHPRTPQNLPAQKSEPAKDSSRSCCIIKDERPQDLNRRVLDQPTHWLQNNCVYVPACHYFLFSTMVRGKPDYKGPPLELQCVNTIRAMSADQPQAANSGHPGEEVATAARFR